MTNTNTPAEVEALLDSGLMGKCLPYQLIAGDRINVDGDGSLATVAMVKPYRAGCAEVFTTDGRAFVVCAATDVFFWPAPKAVKTATRKAA